MAKLFVEDFFGLTIKNNKVRFFIFKDNLFSLNHWDIFDNSACLILYKVFRYWCLKIDYYDYTNLFLSTKFSHHYLVYRNVNVSLLTKSGRWYRMPLKDQ